MNVIKLAKAKIMISVNLKTAYLNVTFYGSHYLSLNSIIVVRKSLVYSTQISNFFPLYSFMFICSCLKFTVVC